MQLNGARIRKAVIAPLFIVTEQQLAGEGVGAAPASLIRPAQGRWVTEVWRRA